LPAVLLRPGLGRHHRRVEPCRSVVHHGPPNHPHADSLAARG
jgi:hypothetical protein